MSDLHSLFFLLRLIEIVVSHHVMVSVELVAHQLLLRSMTWAAGGTYIVISHRPWIKISAELARPLSLNPLKCSRCRQRLNHCRFEQLTTAHFVVNFGIKVKVLARGRGRNASAQNLTLQQSRECPQRGRRRPGFATPSLLSINGPIMVGIQLRGMEASLVPMKIGFEAVTFPSTCAPHCLCPNPQPHSSKGPFTNDVS